MNRPLFISFAKWRRRNNVSRNFIFPYFFHLLYDRLVGHHLFLLTPAIWGWASTDRVMAANMIGTKSIVFVCLLAVFLEESFLIDVIVFDLRYA